MTRIHSMLVPVLLLTFLAGLLLCQPTGEGVIIGAQPDENGWLVDENTTVTDESIWLNGSLTVTSGAVLNLTNVLLQVNSTSSDTYHIAVEPGTTLRAENVTFTRGEGYNYGFRFQANSTGLLNDTLIEYGDALSAKGLVVASDNVSITNSTLRESNYGLVLRASPFISDDTFYNNSVGLYLEETLAVNDLETDNDFTGPQGQPNALADIRYTVSRRVLVVDQDGTEVSDARIYFNTTGGTQLFSGTTDGAGHSFFQRIIIWQVNQTEGNRTLEPFNLTALKLGVTNSTLVNASTPDDMVVELILKPDLVITGFGWGPVNETLLPAGRDNATEYRWKILGNDPAGWTELGFDDSSWDQDPAPFGDTGPYNTNWDGSNTAYFRHKFELPANITILRAQLNTATNDHGAHYLNEQELYNDLGSDAHQYTYWNAETEFDPSLLKAGQTNILASKVENGGNTQYYDAEIELTFIYNDAGAYAQGRLLMRDQDAKIWMTVENQGVIDTRNVDLELALGGEPFAFKNFDINAGQTKHLKLDWEPKEAGNHTFRAVVDPDDDHDEYDEENNEYHVTIFIAEYGGRLQDPGTIELPFNETREVEINLTNIGDLDDTFHLTLRGKPGGWGIQFSSNDVFIEAGQTRNLTLTIDPDQGSDIGDYTIQLEINSSYEEDRETLVVGSGWHNGTRYLHKVYTDEAQIPEYWYARNFTDESSWDVGAAPFADRENNGIQPGTIWDQDRSWLPIRYWFDLPTGVDWDEAILECAYDNYITPYLNDIKLSDRVGGNQHRMSYWNGDGYFIIPKSYFETGDRNLIAVLGQDTGSGGYNRQWLDLELNLVKRGHGSSQGITITILPTREFEQQQKGVETEHLSNSTFDYDIPYYNHGNVDQDVDFQLTVTDSQGGWSAELAVDQVTIAPDSPYKLRVQVTADQDIFLGDYLNLTVSATPDEIPEQATLYYLNLSAVMYDDGVAPITRVLPLAEWVREPTVTLEWEIINGTADTLFYHVYYQSIDPENVKSNWTLWHTYPVQTTSDTFNVRHGYLYRFFSLGEDHSYRIEADKSSSFDMWFKVDLEAPASELVIEALEGSDTGTINATKFRLSWVNLSGSDDVDEYSVYYREKAAGGTFGNWSVAPGMDHTRSKSRFFEGSDGMTYQFASVAHDVAGWDEPLGGPDGEITIDATASQVWLGRLEPTSRQTSVELKLFYADRNDTARLTLQHATYTNSFLPANLAWDDLQSYTAPDLPDNVTLTGLEGDRHHLFRVVSRDHLWNEIYRDDYLETYQGNATDEQTFALRFMIETAPDQFNPHLNVEVDDDGDGRADRGLSLKWELPLTGSMQYYVDYAGSRVVFGDGAAGFKPLNTTTVMVTYEAYDSGQYIDLTRPTSQLYYDVEPVTIATELISSKTAIPLGWRPVTSIDIVSYTISYRSGTTVDSLGAWTDITGWTGLTTGSRTYTAQPDMVYQFRSLATDNAGWVEQKDLPDLQVTVDQTPPAVSGAFTINEKSVTYNFLNISWAASASDDVVAYRLEWGKLAGGPYNSSKTLPVEGQPSQVNYIVRALDRQQTYYFRVVAIDKAGQESQPTEVLKVTMSEKKDEGGSNLLPLVMVVLVVLILLGGLGYYYTQVQGAEKPPQPPATEPLVGEAAAEAAVIAIPGAKVAPPAAENASVEAAPTKTGAGAGRTKAETPATPAKEAFSAPEEPQATLARPEASGPESGSMGDPGAEVKAETEPETDTDDDEFTCPDCGTVFTLTPGDEEQTCPGCGSTH